MKGGENPWQRRRRPQQRRRKRRPKRNKVIMDIHDQRLKLCHEEGLRGFVFSKNIRTTHFASSLHVRRLDRRVSINA